MKDGAPSSARSTYIRPALDSPANALKLVSTNSPSQFRGTLARRHCEDRPNGRIRDLLRLLPSFVPEVYVCACRKQQIDPAPVCPTRDSMHRRLACMIHGIWVRSRM